jgi:hypothetical protein
MGAPSAFKTLRVPWCHFDALSASLRGEESYLRRTYPYRHLIPCSAFKDSPCSLLLHTAPLLEENGTFAFRH